MMRLLACSALIAPLAAKRVATNKQVGKLAAADVTPTDLEDTWLSISVSRSGSFFAEGDDVFTVKEGKVYTGEGKDDDEEPFGELVATLPSHLVLKTHNDVWAMTGTTKDPEQCTKWNEFFEMVKKVKERKSPSNAYALAQTEETNKEDEPIACVDWTFTGETSSPPAGMYSLAETETTGERTMHWLRKPKDGVTIEEALMELTAELIQLSPSRSKFEDRIEWASKTITKLIDLPDDRVAPTVQKLIYTSQFGLGMAQELKDQIGVSIVTIITALKEGIVPSNAQEAPY